MEAAFECKFAGSATNSKKGVAYLVAPGRNNDRDSGPGLISAEGDLIRTRNRLFFGEGLGNGPVAQNPSRNPIVRNKVFIRTRNRRTFGRTGRNRLFGFRRGRNPVVRNGDLIRMGNRSNCRQFSGRRSLRRRFRRMIASKKFIRYVLDLIKDANHLFFSGLLVGLGNLGRRRLVSRSPFLGLVRRRVGFRNRIVLGSQ